MKSPSAPNLSFNNECLSLSLSALYLVRLQIEGSWFVPVGFKGGVGLLFGHN